MCRRPVRNQGQKRLEPSAPRVTQTPLSVPENPAQGRAVGCLDAEFCPRPGNPPDGPIHLI